ncbi:unnamed protein product [Arctogadus glacialis]
MAGTFFFSTSPCVDVFATLPSSCHRRERLGVRFRLGPRLNCSDGHFSTAGKTSNVLPTPQGPIDQQEASVRPDRHRPAGLSTVDITTSVFLFIKEGMELKQNPPPPPPRCILIG